MFARGMSSFTHTWMNLGCQKCLQSTSAMPVIMPRAHTETCHMTSRIALPVYSASSSDVNLVQRFLARCYKRRYISECIDINEILEKIDRKLFKKIKENVTSPLHDMLPVTKESSRRLRRQTL